MKTRLFTPGPVEIPIRILRALSQPPPHHRTDAFRDVLRRVTTDLKALHKTEGEVFLLGATGTGAMEAAVVNLMAPGAKALAVNGGKFGERWVRLLETYGVPHEVLDVEWGHAVDPAAIEERLAKDEALAVVFATHSETSTGALNDLQAIAAITRAQGRRLVVDAVTSLAVHPLEQDAWGVDVVVCGSQKGLMLPPGIATVSLAPWAADAIEGERLPRFYFDLRRARKALPNGETPWTPPVSHVLALEEALTMILREEGLGRVQDRHRRLAFAMRAGGEALGLRLFPANPSHAVTAFLPPEGVEATALVKRLRDRHGMIVAGGQDQLKGRILRIGHMGAYDLADLHALIGAIDKCLAFLAPDSPRSSGDAMGAASRAWDTA
jgi:serine---pyruvate transaminase